MRTYLYILLLLMGIVLVACKAGDISSPVQPQKTVAITLTRPILSPTVLSSPSSIPTQVVTAVSTPSPTIIDMSEITPTAASETIIASPDSRLVLVANMEPDPVQFSMPENAWWSEDSQTLYYQNIETQEAWAYDLLTEISTSIPYVPRSLHELELQIQASLPENASIVSVSPRNRFVLYRKPLAEPILIPDDPSIDPTPEVKVPNSFTAELWLRKDGQDFNLGLVDACFGLLGKPLWSTSENVVVVNGVSIDGIACLHPVWLIDTEALSLEPLNSPWIENYKILDVSANGDLFLVRSFTDDLNYLYDSITNERWSIPVEDTDRMILVEADLSPNCLVFELEFSEKTVRDHVWYCEPIKGKVKYLDTIEGIIFDSTVSPDKKNVAFLVANDIAMGENFYKNVVPGLWILAMP